MSLPSGARPPVWWRILAFLALAIPIHHLVRGQIELVGDWRVDDAYIAFSFARNLAEGRGLVYSYGMVVEGYSNFLWVILQGICHAIRPHSEWYFWARVLALVFLAILGWGTYRLVRLRAGYFSAALVLLLIATSTDMVRGAMSGLETVPFAALLVCGFAHYAIEPFDRRRWSLFWFVAAALMRIDGMVALVFVVGFELVSSLVERRFCWRKFLLWAAAPLALYAIYYSWRWWYYGLLFPTTYYAKSNPAALDPFRSDNLAWDTLRATGGLAAVPFMFYGLIRKPSREGVLLAGYIVYHAAYVIHVGGDWMPFMRFWLPVVPLFLVLMAWGISQAWHDLKAKHPVYRVGFLALPLLAGDFMAKHLDESTVETPQEQNKKIEAAHVANHTKQNLLETTRLLRWVVRFPGDKLVTDYGGVFAVYTDATIIEMWGLCNKDIAIKGDFEGIQPVYGKTCIECYRDFQPDYFHVIVPIVRTANTFTSVSAMLPHVFQGPQIDRVLNFRVNYAAGRVMDKRGRTLWFLERRRPDRELITRNPVAGIVVDYPFEKTP